VLGTADARIFDRGYHDQSAELWSKDGRLLATSHQLVYYRDPD
jgi:acyl-CoA thioesterase